jgi:hypothetical protein
LANADLIDDRPFGKLESCSIESAVVNPTIDNQSGNCQSRIWQ